MVVDFQGVYIIYNMYIVAPIQTHVLVISLHGVLEKTRGNASSITSIIDLVKLYMTNI